MCARARHVSRSGDGARSVMPDDGERALFPNARGGNTAVHPAATTEQWTGVGREKSERTRRRCRRRPTRALLTRDMHFRGHRRCCCYCCCAAVATARDELIAPAQHAVRHIIFVIQGQGPTATAVAEPKGRITPAVLLTHVYICIYYYIIISS